MFRKVAIALLAVACLRPAVQAVLAAEPPPTQRQVQAVDAALADEIDAAWLKHDWKWWFPRNMDRRQGGFFENYEPPKYMRPKQGGAKTIVFQSRQTWVAATALRLRPDLANRADLIARHGFAFLTEHMVDPAHGGVFWGVDARTKQPRWDGKKHAYGISFAIYAGAAFEKALPGEGGQEFAAETFRWLDRHAHDDEHGGYFEHLARDGTPIRNEDQPEAGGRRLPYDTRYSLKTHNTNLHLLEAFTELYGVWPDAQLRVRIEELLDLFLDEMYAEVEGPGGETVGTFWETFHEDWSVHDDEHVSYGHNVEGAFLILEAAEAIGAFEGEAGGEILRKARFVVDGSLAAGWDNEAGGLWNKGTVEAAQAERKDWWVQAESLNALMIMDHYFGQETSIYREKLAAQWSLIEGRMLDPRPPGGWFSSLDERNRPSVDAPKAQPWKTSYHTTRALLNTADHLRGDFGHAAHGSD